MDFYPELKQHICRHMGHLGKFILKSEIASRCGKALSNSSVCKVQTALSFVSHDLGS